MRRVNLQKSKIHKQKKQAPSENPKTSTTTHVLGHKIRGEQVQADFCRNLASACFFCNFFPFVRFCFSINHLHRTGKTDSQREPAPNIAVSKAQASLCQNPNSSRFFLPFSIPFLGAWFSENHLHRKTSSSGFLSQPRFRLFFLHFFPFVGGASQ